MSPKPSLLCVDDESDVVDGLRLSLRKSYAVTTATSGALGLEIFDAAMADSGQEPFVAVVSDMRMPDMNGAEFLTEIRARSAHTPRILLSGQADFESTITAINDAKIFRFLTKPCDAALLIETIDEAMETVRLRAAERELLDHTLHGTVSMLNEVLGLVSVTAYSRTMRVREIVRQLNDALGREFSWELDVATLLSQIGCVVVADDPGNAAATPHGEIAGNLLEKIPRLEVVADIVRLQHGQEPIVDADVAADWTDQELNAEMLRAAVVYDHYLSRTSSKAAAIKALSALDTPPPDFILKLLQGCRPAADDLVEASANVVDLVPGMELLEDLQTATGAKLAAKSTTLTTVLIERIRGFAGSAGIAEPIPVLAPRSAISRMRAPA